jgi:starch phosphorylase
MATLTPRFSTNRMVREYVERFYLPLAAAFRRRAADQAKVAVALVGWRAALAEHWATLHVGDVRFATSAGEHRFEAHVYLGDLEAEDVRVELFAEGAPGEGPRRREMTREVRLSGAANAFLYAGSVPDLGPAEHWTVRVVPHHPEALIPLEAEPILWQTR